MQVSPISTIANIFGNDNSTLPRAPRTPSSHYSDDAVEPRLPGRSRAASPVIVIDADGNRLVQPAPRHSNWKLYVGIVGLAAVAAGLGAGTAYGINHHNVVGAAVGTGGATPTPSITHATATPTTFATSSTKVTSATRTPSATPSVFPLQDPSVQPEPSDTDTGEDVGTWQPWDVSLFPAGIATPGDANGERIPGSSTAQTLQALAFAYPELVNSLVQLRPNNTYQLNMVDPFGGAISVQVDNKFLTSRDGALLQVGSKANKPTWATVMEKGLAKWSSAFKTASNRTGNFGLTNLNSADVLGAYLPGATQNAAGDVKVPGQSAIAPKAATDKALQALGVSFSALPQDAMRQALFSNATQAARAGDVPAFKDALADLTAEIDAKGLRKVAAYDNVLSGLGGILAWIEKA